VDGSRGLYGLRTPLDKQPDVVIPLQTCRVHQGKSHSLLGTHTQYTSCTNDDNTKYALQINTTTTTVETTTAIMTQNASNNFNRVTIWLLAAYVALSARMYLSLVNMEKMIAIASSIDYSLTNLPYAATTTTKATLPSSRMALELENSSPRFYIYTDRNITQDKPSRVAPVYRRRYGHEADFELAVLNALKNHSLRTYDPEQAILFIVPTPIGKILTTKGLSYTEAFTALTSHPLFRKHGGNRHVLMSAPLVTYSNEHRYMKFLSEWWGRLANVTAALSYDPLASQQAYQRGELAGSDYEAVFSTMKPVVHHSFSTCLGEASEDFGIPSYARTAFNHVHCTTNWA
jgi:hypothetical protein